MGRRAGIGREAARVSSGILTDHPEYRAGEIYSYFYGEYYYQFEVNGPGEYRFIKKVEIVGNEYYIDELEASIE